MPEQEKNKNISHNEFLKEAGAVVNGAAVSSLAANDRESVPAGTGTGADTGVSTVDLTVNGKLHRLIVGYDVQPWQTLIFTIREKLGLPGTKVGCDRGECGMCTVLMDGKPVLACTTLTVECDGKSIETIENLYDSANQKLHPIQQAFIEMEGGQCGFCTPAAIMATKALLTRNPDPSMDEIKVALDGIQCRCTGYIPIFKSVLRAAEIMRGK